jgi:hypothetical protein
MAVGDLCAVADVQAYLSLADTQDQDLLQTLVTNASAFVSNYANLNFPATSYTETRNGHGGSELPFLQYPVTGVTSLTISGRSIPAADPTTAYGFGYLYDDQILYLRNGVFPRGPQNVVIVYSAGMDTVPAEVAQATIEIVALKYRRRLTQDQNSKSINGEVVSFNNADMPNSARTALDTYKRVYMA